MFSRYLSFTTVFLAVACSTAGSTKQDSPIADAPVTGDPGSNPPTDAGSGTVNVSDGGNTPTPSPTPGMDSGTHAPTNQAECIAVCEGKYPKPAALNKQLDAQCFLGGACVTQCNDLAANGKLYPVTPDPDAAAPAACPIGEGVDPIMTPSASCSDCIANTPTCCTLWVDIFGTADGRALNACAVKCFSDFKN